jgi:2OG-Fe(II) oxygenase superfamily
LCRTWTVGSLEQYAERILPANVHQEFLQAKNRLKKKYPLECFVQAPVVPLEDVQRFCSLMMRLPSDNDFLDNDNDNSFISIVVTGKLEMAVIPLVPEIPVKPSEPPPPRILATIQRGGGPVEVIAVDDGSVELSWMGIPYRLFQGGLLTIYPRMVKTEEAVEVTNALMEKPSLFGQHLIQGFNEEPRILAHSFHHEATDDFEGEPQPGYRYNHITVKARPLQRIPSLYPLSERCQWICDVPEWNIGTTVVLYRNGKDKMCQHKDKYCCCDWSDISNDCLHTTTIHDR